MMLVLLAGGLALASLLFLFRLLRGPSLLDRVVATQGVVLCAALLIATLAADPRWILASVALVLSGAALAFASLKIARGQSFATGLASEGDAP